MVTERVPIILIMDYSCSSDINWEEKLKEMAVATLSNESTSSRRLWVHPINVEGLKEEFFLDVFKKNVINTTECRWTSLLTSTIW